MQEEIIILLGGRVAEKLVMEDISTGASNDIERATKIARAMVTRYGFSDKLGPIVYGQDESEVFLGRDFNHTRNYSENVAAQIDTEIREIVDNAYERCEQILMEQMPKLHETAAYLLEHEKMSGEDFRLLLEGKLAQKLAEQAAAEQQAAGQAAETAAAEKAPQPEQSDAKQDAASDQASSSEKADPSAEKTPDSVEYLRQDLQDREKNDGGSDASEEKPEDPGK